ncbi:MAG: tetratricopeptide repeat protein [Flavobacteriales bacterium]|nr:tetratricopeptide repeat protein [Flavobacteriales bacterium]
MHRLLKIAMLSMLIGVVGTSHAQDQHKVDSLFNCLQSCGEDSTYINCYLQLSGEFLFNNPDSAFSFARHSFQRAQESKDTASMAECYNVFGIVHTIQGKYLGGLENFQESLNWYRLLNDKRGIASIVNNIGVIYGYMDNYSESIKHYRESFEISMDLEDFEGAALNLFNIATDFLEVNQFDSARTYTAQLDAFQNTHGQFIHCGPVKGELFLHDNQLDSAWYWFDEGQAASLEDEDYHQYTACLVGKVEVALRQMDFPQASALLDETERLSRENQFNETLLEVFELRSQLYEAVQQYDKAFLAKDQYLDLKQQLDSINNFQRVSELNARYESEKRERELAEVTAQMAASEANKKARDRVYLVIGVSILLIIVMLIGSLIRKKRTNRLLNTQNLQITQQRQNILASINYAKKIQNSILIPEERIRQFLPESFVYFQPKDIVSGDFYWFEEIDNKLILATVDCTGHGVPGAFMSLIANDKLNKVVHEKGILEPSEVLTQVHREIVNSLNQEHGTDNSQDGMDMSLCVIDRSDRSIAFAGAQNPIFLVRDNQVEEIKADNLSLGGTVLSQKLNGSFRFSTKKLYFEEGTALFMFTDGYIDQFGGEQNKKLNKSLFKNLILNTCQESFDKAKNSLDSYFATWRGDNPQIDDVLIIGARL